MGTRDLLQPLRSGGWTLLEDPPTTVTDHATMATDGYRVTEFECDTRAGTHVDAPANVLSDGDMMDAYPPARFPFPESSTAPDWLPGDNRSGHPAG